MSESRTEKTVHNAYTALIYQIVTALLNFVVRRVFLKHISVYLLGLDSIFSNLINMLTLLDFGVGTSSIYFLSRAFAKNDMQAVNVYYHAYVILSRIVAVIVAAVGIVFSYHLGFFIDNAGYTENYIRLVFYGTFARTIAYYLFACPKIVLSCAQKNYINSNINTISSILFSIIKIIVIIKTENYNYYLYTVLAEVLFSFLLTNIAFYRMYPRKKADPEAVKNAGKAIMHYGRSLIFLSINTFIFNSTDSLIISKFLGVHTVGMINNYYMIVNGVSLISTEMIESASASVYNFVNDKNSNNTDNLDRFLNEMTFICFVIGLFCSVCLFALTDQFIALFFGVEFVMTKGVIASFVMNFMMVAIMYPLIYYEAGRGLKPKESLYAILSAVTNIIVSIWLAQYFQAVGVILGTVVSNMILYFGRIKIVFENLHLNLKKYIKNLIYYIIIYGLDLWIVWRFLPNLTHTLLQWIVQALICCAITFISVLLFWKTDSFQSLKSLIKQYLKKRNDANSQLQQ